jgi:hypothetical protein
MAQKPPRSCSCSDNLGVACTRCAQRGGTSRLRSHRERADRGAAEDARRQLLQDATSERNWLQKILEDANVKLASVLADPFGVSGQLMLEALLRGEAGPNEIAELAKGKARRKIPELAASLDGHRMSDHHRHMIHYSLVARRRVTVTIKDTSNRSACQSD